MLPTIAPMAVQHLNLSCFGMLIWCHLFSVWPEISPWTALESWVVQSRSCTEKWKEKNINNQTFKNKEYQKPTQQSNSFFKKLWKINPIDQNLHYLGGTIEYSREGAMQEISNEESWGWWGQTELVQWGPCETNLPASYCNIRGFFTTDEKCCQCFLLHLLF